jgi:hypothetical protein
MPQPASALFLRLATEVIDPNARAFPGVHFTVRTRGPCVVVYFDGHRFREEHGDDSFFELAVEFYNAVVPYGEVVEHTTLNHGFELVLSPC